MQSVEKTWFERSEQEQSAPAEELADEISTKEEKVYVAFLLEAHVVAFFKAPHGRHQRGDRALALPGRGLL
jgi:hypothetical protein